VVWPGKFLVVVQAGATPQFSVIVFFMNRSNDRKSGIFLHLVIPDILHRESIPIAVIPDMCYRESL
jgi:hypothetical protein